MTNYLELIKQIKSQIRQNTVDELIQGSKDLFLQNPSMFSFGWHQCTEPWTDGREITLLRSLEVPDINGALGEYIRNSKVQEVVAEFLTKFDPVMLQVAFGDDIDISIDRDGDIEITDSKYQAIEV